MKFIKILSKSMALALQNARHYEEIKQFADKLQDEVNTATENLRKTNKKLRALNKSKDEFLSMTSHQLRPQLTAARGFISMIGMEETTKQERSELVELSGRSMDRMARVLSDLLNMTRLEDGKFKIYREKTNLVELITSEVDGFRTAASKKNIELNVITKRKKIDLEIDWVKIREVVFNFIDNAIQYSPDDGIVAVRILASSQEVEMMVEDQGIGVSEKDQKKLFSKFYRGQNAEELRPSGTGIGLFVAKEVIEAHKGEIVFKSEEGKGSTFGFRLPRNARK